MKKNELTTIAVLVDEVEDLKLALEEANARIDVLELYYKRKNKIGKIEYTDEEIFRFKNQGWSWGQLSQATGRSKGCMQGRYNRYLKENNLEEY